MKRAAGFQYYRRFVNNHEKLFNDSMRKCQPTLFIFRQQLLALNLRLAGVDYSVSFALEGVTAGFLACTTQECASVV